MEIEEKTEILKQQMLSSDECKQEQYKKISDDLNSKLLELRLVPESYIIGDIHHHGPPRDDENYEVVIGDEWIMCFIASCPNMKSCSDNRGRLCEDKKRGCYFSFDKGIPVTKSRYRWREYPIPSVQTGKIGKNKRLIKRLINREDNR